MGDVKKRFYARKLVRGNRYTHDFDNPKISPDDYRKYEMTLEDINQEYPEWRVVNVQYVKDGDCPYYIFLLEREINRFQVGYV